MYVYFNRFMHIVIVLLSGKGISRNGLSVFIWLAYCANVLIASSSDLFYLNGADGGINFWAYIFHAAYPVFFCVEFFSGVSTAGALSACARTLLRGL